MRVKPRLRWRYAAVPVTIATALLAKSEYLPGSTMQSCGWCIDTEYNGLPAHYFDPEGTFWMDGAHKYLATSNCGIHATCPAAVPAVQSVERAAERAKAGDPREMEILIRDHPESVTLNAERSAVQVKGCRGDVIAHIPLTPSQFAALMQQRAGDAKLAE